MQSTTTVLYRKARHGTGTAKNYKYFFCHEHGVWSCSWSWRFTLAIRYGARMRIILHYANRNCLQKMIFIFWDIIICRHNTKVSISFEYKVIRQVNSQTAWKLFYIPFFREPSIGRHPRLEILEISLAVNPIRTVENEECMHLETSYGTARNLKGIGSRTQLTAWIPSTTIRHPSHSDS